jgi:hypothetical protein
MMLFMRIVLGTLGPTVDSDMGASIRSVLAWEWCKKMGPTMMTLRYAWQNGLTHLRASLWHVRS